MRVPSTVAIGGRPEAIARERTGMACRRSPVATERGCSRDFPPAAARGRDRSRVEAAVMRTLAAYAVGGGRPRSSGTAGSGARNSAATSGGRSRPRWRAVRTTLASTCWVSAPWRVRLPPHTLRMTTAGRMACSARQLVASSEGSHRRVSSSSNAGASNRRFSGLGERPAAAIANSLRVLDSALRPPLPRSPPPHEPPRGGRTDELICPTNLATTRTNAM